MEMAEMNSTNWSQSVAGVCLKDGKVLLARHTYGSGKGKLIIPGGYVKFGELPEETLVREYLEETGVKVRAGRLLGIRFNEKDWYVVFAAEYIEGVERSDGDETARLSGWMLMMHCATTLFPALQKRWSSAHGRGPDFT